MPARCLPGPADGWGLSTAPTKRCRFCTVGGCSPRRAPGCLKTTTHWTGSGRRSPESRRRAGCWRHLNTWGWFDWNAGCFPWTRCLPGRGCRAAGDSAATLECRRRCGSATGQWPWRGGVARARRGTRRRSCCCWEKSIWGWSGRRGQGLGRRVSFLWSWGLLAGSNGSRSWNRENRSGWSVPGRAFWLFRWSSLWPLPRCRRRFLVAMGACGERQWRIWEPEEVGNRLLIWRVGTGRDKARRHREKQKHRISPC